MEVSGPRSSWLTKLRNSARSRSISSRGVRSCKVTTTVSTRPSSAKTGVALTSTVTLRPSGNRDHHLLGAHRLADAQGLGQRHLGQGDFPSVGPPEGQRVQNLFQLGPRLPQGLPASGGSPG